MIRYLAFKEQLISVKQKLWLKLSDINRFKNYLIRMTLAVKRKP